MSGVIKRNIQITYDTLNDMIHDTNLKPNMVVNTLGKDRISDGYGSTYKILAYEGENLTVKGPRIEGDKLVAQEIAGTNSTDDIDKLKKSISSLSAEIEKTGSEEKQKETAALAVKEVTEGIIENNIVDTITALDVGGIEFNLLYNGQKAIFISSRYGDRFQRPDEPEPPVDPEPFVTASELAGKVEIILNDMVPPYTTTEAVSFILSTLENNTDETLYKTEEEIRAALEEYIASKKNTTGTGGGIGGSGSGEGDGGEDPNPIEPDPEEPVDPINPDPDNPDETDQPIGGDEGETNGNETGNETDETTNDSSSDDSSSEEVVQNEDITPVVLEETGEEGNTDETTDKSVDPIEPDPDNPDEPEEEPPLTAVNTPGVTVNLSEDKTVATISFSLDDFPWALPKAFEISNYEITSLKITEGVSCQYYGSSQIYFEINRINRPEVIYYT